MLFLTSTYRYGQAKETNKKANIESNAKSYESRECYRFELTWSKKKRNLHFLTVPCQAYEQFQWLI
jgi:hypothetical protein